MTIINEQSSDKSREKPVDQSFFGDYKERQGNTVENPNTLPPEQTPPVETPTSIINDKTKEIFALREDKPTYDPQRPEELRRLAKNATIAKGINLIGDNVALAMGANVNRRQPDNSEKEYLGKIYDYLDDYTKRVDNGNYRDFVNRLRAGQMALGQMNADRNYELSKDKMAQDNAKYLASLAQSKDNFDRQMALNYDKLGQSKEYQDMTIEERQRHNQAIERNYKRPPISPNKMIKIKTGDGKVHEFSPEQASYLRSEALRNLPKLSKSFPNLIELYDTDEIDPNTGDIKKGYKISSKISDEDLIRAQIEFEFEKEKVNKNGYRAYYGKDFEPETKKQVNPIDYSKINY